MKKNFPEYSVKTREIPYFIVKIGSFFDDTIKMAMPHWNKELNLDNSESINKLGLVYRDIHTSLVECTKSMIDCGIIKKKVKKVNGSGDMDRSRS